MGGQIFSRYDTRESSNGSIRISIRNSIRIGIGISIARENGSIGTLAIQGTDHGGDWSDTLIGDLCGASKLIILRCKRKI